MTLKSRLARLEAQRPPLPAGPRGELLAGLSLDELRALYHGWAHDPTPRPDLDALTLPELTALYWQTVRGQHES